MQLGEGQNTKGCVAQKIMQLFIGHWLIVKCYFKTSI